MVEFHRESIRLMGPQYILLLMAHEFGHKIAYKSGYVQDNPSIGVDDETCEPLFASGRQFLDTMAAAFVDTAKRRGLLGAEFLLRDRFECRVTQAGGQPVGLLTTSPRLFKSENRRIYETGFGKTPSSEAISSIFEWIECFYNRKRIHSSLGYMTPEEYEARLLAA